MIPNQNVITEEQKKIIVDKHNELRRKVAKGQEPDQPAASNMKEMVKIINNLGVKSASFNSRRFGTKR